MKKKIKEELKKLGIAIVYLFGSHALGKTSPMSDVDLGFVLKKFPPDEDTPALYDKLFELFSEIFPNSKLDLVFLQKAPLSLQFMAVKYSKILFEQDPLFTGEYECRVINEYIDFAPILEMFDKVMLEKYVPD